MTKTTALLMELSGIGCLLWAAATIHSVAVLIMGGFLLISAGTALERSES